MINQQAKKFQFQLECLQENIEKYITFSVPIKQKFENKITITYRLKFIESFSSTSLSSLVDNLPEIKKKECKLCKERRNIKSTYDFKKNN